MDFTRFRRIALIYAVSHFIAGSLYIPFHTSIPFLCNLISDFLGFPFEPLPLPSEKFWFTLSVSMMYMIAFSGYYASRDEKRVWTWPVIIVSKGISTLFFIIFFFLDTLAFAYIVGVIVDGPLFVIALLTWRKYISGYAYTGSS